MKHKKLTFLTKGDERGNLIAIEENKNIPSDLIDRLATVNTRLE